MYSSTPGPPDGDDSSTTCRSTTTVPAAGPIRGGPGRAAARSQGIWRALRVRGGPGPGAVRHRRDPVRRNKAILRTILWGPSGPPAGPQRARSAHPRLGTWPLRSAADARRAASPRELGRSPRRCGRHLVTELRRDAMSCEEWTCAPRGGAASFPLYPIAWNSRPGDRWGAVSAGFRAVPDQSPAGAGQFINTSPAPTGTASPHPGPRPRLFFHVDRESITLPCPPAGQSRRGKPDVLPRPSRKYPAPELRSARPSASRSGAGGRDPGQRCPHLAGDGPGEVPFMRPQLSAWGLLGRRPGGRLAPGWAAGVPA